MDKLITKNTLTAGILMLSTASLLHGAAAFDIVPTTSTAMLMPSNSSAMIKYQVTNNTALTRTLTMKPIQGVSQVTGDAGLCSNPFILAPNQSCTLTFQVNGSQMPPRISGGPVVCKTNGDNTPDPFLCSQPDVGNRLAVTQIGAIPDQKAYITNWNGGFISLCDVSTFDGSLSHCVNTASGVAFASPEAIALNPEGTLLYVANISGSFVSFCSVDATTGALSLCAATGGVLDGADGIAINPAGTLAYVSNAGSNSVSVCAIDSITGQLSNSCTSTGNNFHTPSDLTLNALGTIAYVSNVVSGTVSICPVDVSNGLINCDRTTIGFNGPEGITLHPSGQFAYLTNNGTNNISVCQVDYLSGALYSCKITDGQFDGYGNLAFNNMGTRAYVPRYLAGKVSVCSVDLRNGSLSDCHESNGSGFEGPSGILLK